MTPETDHTPHGFSLLEVVVVLALMSVFAVYAIARTSGTNASLVAQTQVLKSHMIYAQMRSMNTDLNWGIHYHHGANEDQRYYELFTGGIVPAVDASTTRFLPGQTRKRIPIGEMGITILSAPDGSERIARSFQLSFDSWGRPDSDLGSGTLILTLRMAGQSDQQLTITQNTGFIP